MVFCGKMTSYFLDDDMQGKYYIINDHDMEIFEGLEYNGNGSRTSISPLNDCEIVEVDADDAIDKPATIERCEKHDEREMREKCVNSDENKEMKKENPIYVVNTSMREIELTINTSTIEEVIFKKHRVEILNKDTRSRVMEGVVCDYTLVGRVYDPDIILNFEDGRSFYNENFGYLMRFYI